MSQELIFGYLDFYGRGQICRLLLAYTGTQFKEVTYSFSKFTEWLQKDKKQLGLQFPSLPYVSDGKFKMTQSKAIQRYIIHRAKKEAQLLGKNNKQKALINNIQGVLRDVLNALIQLFFKNHEYEEFRKKTYQTIEPKLLYLNSFIGSGSGFLNRVTYPDFILAIMFQFLKIFYPHEYSNFNNITRLVDYINSLQPIQKYYRKSSAIKNVIAPEQINNPKFLNLGPIKQIVSQGIQNSAKQKILQKLSQIRDNQNGADIQDQIFAEEVTTKSQIKSNIKKQEVQIQKVQQVRIKKQQQTPTHTQQDIKPFHARVQQFLKAASNTQNKNKQISNLDNYKTSIITPSKIALHKTEEVSQIPWKLTQSNTQNKNNNSSKNGPVILGYWAIRGLGQIFRHLLSYCQLEFSQKLYLTQQEWFNGDKLTLNLPFPNLPYLIDGDLKLTQSLAINRYVIRVSNKKELLGKNLKDQFYIQNTTKILSDLFKQIRVLCFTQDKQKKKSAQLQAKLTPVFSKIESLVGNQSYVLGYLTLLDFYIDQISYYIEKIYPQLYQKHEFFSRIRNSIKSQDQIQKYYSRQVSIKGPFMPPSALISF